MLCIWFPSHMARLALQRVQAHRGRDIAVGNATGCNFPRIVGSVVMMKAFLGRIKSLVKPSNQRAPQNYDMKGCNQVRLFRVTQAAYEVQTYAILTIYTMILSSNVQSSA